MVWMNHSRPAVTWWIKHERMLKILFKIGFYYGNKTRRVSDLEEWRWWQGETIWSRLSDQRQGSRGIHSKAGIEIDISKSGGLSFWLCFVLEFKDKQVHTFSEHKKDIQLTCSYIQWLENMSYDEHVFISVFKSTLIFFGGGHKIKNVKVIKQF